MQNAKTVHKLYVRIASDRDQNKEDILATTNKILRYIHGIQPVLVELGITVKVEKIMSEHLRDSRIVSALKSKGITEFPALVTAKSTYLGVNAIMNLYDSNIKQFREFQQRSYKYSYDGGDDPVKEFYKSEMTEEKKKYDDEEEDEGMMKNSSMMKRYNKEVARRSKTWKTHTPPQETSARGSAGGGVRGSTHGSAHGDTDADMSVVAPRTSQIQENPMDDDDEGADQDDLLMRNYLEGQDYDGDDY